MSGVHKDQGILLGGDDHGVCEHSGHRHGAPPPAVLSDHLARSVSESNLVHCKVDRFGYL